MKHVHFTMMVLILLTSLLLAVDIACGEQPSKQTHHINKKKDWSDFPFTDYKGNEAENEPLARSHPYDNETEAEINKQINWELFAHYTYLSMAYHFNRDDIYLPGFHRFFKESAEEEMKHAQKFMEYQNRRGGRVKLHHIMKPVKDQWGSGLDAIEDALQLKKIVYRSLLDLHKFASDKVDPQLTDFLESGYLEEQLKSIKELSNYVNTLRRFNDSYALGEYQFDEITLGGDKHT